MQRKICPKCQGGSYGIEHNEKGVVLKCLSCGTKYGPGTEGK